MNLINQNAEQEIQDRTICPLESGNTNKAIERIEHMLRNLYELIPDNKRIQIQSQ